MNRIIHVSVLSLITALAACGGGGGDASSDLAQAETPAAAAPIAMVGASPVADANCGLPDFQQELIMQVNQARANSRMCGSTFYDAAAPLSWNNQLSAAATGHATDMANNNYFSHTSLDGRVFSQRITAAGYAWSVAGENIAAGQTAIEQVMTDWLQSPGHCANIMKDMYTEVGVSCVKDDASAYKMYWAMEFGRPQ